MTEKEIEACLQKQLSILESAYIVLLVSSGIHRPHNGQL